MAPMFQRLGLVQGVLESTVAILFEPQGQISNRLGSKPDVSPTDRILGLALPSKTFLRSRQAVV